MPDNIWHSHGTPPCRLQPDRLREPHQDNRAHSASLSTLGAYRHPASSQCGMNRAEPDIPGMLDHAAGPAVEARRSSTAFGIRRDDSATRPAARY